MAGSTHGAAVTAIASALPGLAVTTRCSLSGSVGADCAVRAVDAVAAIATVASVAAIASAAGPAGGTGAGTGAATSGIAASATRTAGTTVLSLLSGLARGDAVGTIASGDSITSIASAAAIPAGAAGALGSRSSDRTGATACATGARRARGACRTAGATVAACPTALPGLTCLTGPLRQRLIGSVAESVCPDAAVSAIGAVSSVATARAVTRRAAVPVHTDGADLPTGPGVCQTACGTGVSAAPARSACAACDSARTRSSGRGGIRTG
ncbi:hypothetical protein WN67_33120 [Mycolicibacterium obuense]|uniref:Uncharacterized protein n=1 Tax=Mycolicibacterium obuense TaxID=1807 RepID=A0A0M2WCP1_9MYCO|nr:hypothetical protein WN67_33120 [Mycolicibacterium obuense]